MRLIFDSGSQRFTAHMTGSAMQPNMMNATTGFKAMASAVVNTT
jgi:hypothetical protein